jgi:hypothetical protein
MIVPSTKSLEAARNKAEAVVAEDAQPSESPTAKTTHTDQPFRTVH